MSKDIALNIDTGDLAIGAQDLYLVEKIDYIEQKLIIRLRFFFSEWFLDNTLGVKYVESIFVKNPDLDLVESLLKATILETPGVVSLVSFSLDLSTTRELTVTFKANTDYGIITFNEVVP